jgi:hypothetical protein
VTVPESASNNLAPSWLKSQQIERPLTVRDIEKRIEMEVVRDNTDFRYWKGYGMVPEEAGFAEHCQPRGLTPTLELPAEFCKRRYEVTDAVRFASLPFEFLLQLFDQLSNTIRLPVLSPRTRWEID